MADATKSAVARAAEKFAAHIGSLLPSASSSSSTPNCNTAKIAEDTKRLSRTLDWIRAALGDAENNNKMNTDLDQYWLEELQGVAYDAEDVLDDFLYVAMKLRLMDDSGFAPGSDGEDATEAVEHKIREEENIQVKRRRTEATRLQVCCPSSPTPSHEIIAFLCDVEQRIEVINARIVEIKKNDEAMRSIGSCGRRDADIPTRQPTSSLIQESDIFGRDEDLEAVKKFLLSDITEPCSRISHVPVMAIVGMGGLGKTTLAQLAYNDDEVKRHFQLKSWVCVSEGFDLLRLTEAMVQSLNLKPSGLLALDPLQRKLEEILEGGRFLLVLDDIWDVEDLSRNWDQFTAPILNKSAGSKIIMTTRNEAVSKMVRGISTYRLPCLRGRDCLKLLRRWAFDGRDPSSYRKLKDTGKKIAKKCRGLPLVAKTLGGLLHTTDDERTWMDILESDVWNINIQESDIIPILKLSYQHLPAHLKRCFRYCSVFPKDYEFDRDRLIWMWMAHGYIKVNGRKPIEDIGKEYFDDLLSRSFFQCSQKYQTFLMHDLFHDLARCISGDVCCNVEDDKPCLIESHVRHISFVVSNDPIKSAISAEDISQPGSLRSCLIIGHFLKTAFHNVKLLNDLLTRMENLRVLDLSVYRLEEFPDSISRLRHLRYLGLEIAVLPKSLGSLYHLQTLRFGVCGWCPRKLPDYTSHLLSLRHLIFPNNLVSIEYPVGIGRLTNLQTMPGFYVSPKHGHAKLGELRDMNNIKRRLEIAGINNLTDVSEAKNACLDKKKNLSTLTLEWEHLADPSAIDDEVLESLKPNPKLEKLCISGFKGRCHPSWLGDGSFSKLTRVELDGCQNWTSLPPLGQLPSLKWLSISSAVQVEYVGPEFFLGGFPQLEELTLRGMNGWTSWCGAHKGECSRLQTLQISSCEELESLSLVNLDALRYLEIQLCPKFKFCSSSLQLPLHQLPSLQKFKIRSIYGVGEIDGDFSDSQSDILKFKKPHLGLVDIGQLGISNLLGQSECARIRQLTITGCANLMSLPLCNLNALVYVRICDCPQLKFSSASPQIRELPSLRLINVQHTYGAEFIHISFSQRGTRSLETSHLQLTNVDQSEALSLLVDCPFIRRLTVSRCASFTSLPFGHLNVLAYMIISECASVTSLPFGSLNALEHVEISECTQLSFSSEGQLSPRLRLLRVNSCPSVTSLPFGNQNLLEDVGKCCRILSLIITRCANLFSLPLGVIDACGYLKISDCPQLHFSNEGHLSSRLQVMHIDGCPFVIKWCKQHRKRLVQLRRLEIEGTQHLVLRNVSTMQENGKRHSRFLASQAHTLELEWDDFINLRSDSCSEADLLETFLPDEEKLGKLVLRGYIGCRFPSWLGHPSFSNLYSVTLLDCSQCVILPPLGQLPHLKKLYVEGSCRVEHVGDEFSDVDGNNGSSQRSSFPLLTKLEFHDMPIWEEWRGIKVGDLPLLCKLVLKHCPKLRTLPYLPPTLKELELEACEELICISPFDSSAQALQSLKSLRRLLLNNCPKLDFSVIERPPPALQYMALTHCPLLLTWCDGHCTELACIPEIWVDGTRVYVGEKKHVRLQTEETRMDKDPHASSTCFQNIDNS